MVSSPAEPVRPVYEPGDGPPAGGLRLCARGAGDGAPEPDESIPGTGRAAGPGGAATAVAEFAVARPERADDDRQVPTVVVVGSASRDLDDRDPRGWRLGGGASYGALTLARIGLSVGVVLGVDAEAAAAAELGLLRSAGAELHLVRLPRGPVFRVGAAPTGRLLRCEEAGGPLPVAALPPASRAARAWYLAPIADELPDGWAAIAPGAIVALGWQGLLRQLERGSQVRPRPAGPRAIVRRADLVSASIEDLEPGTDLRALLRLLRTGTLCTLTRGERGGLAIAARPGAPRILRYPALPAPAVVDATGAGDAFLAGLLAARIVPELAGGTVQLAGALRFAAAVGAAHVAGAGLASVPTLAAVRDVLRRSTSR